MSFFTHASAAPDPGREIGKFMFRVAKWFLRWRLGRVTGLALFAGSLLAYRSSVHRPVLGLWSWPFFMTIVGALTCCLAVLVMSWQAGRRMRSGDLPAWPSMVADVGMLCWGAAYLLSTSDLRVNAVRMLSLNLFGSDSPAAALLEWVALALFTIAGFALAVRALGRSWVNVLLALGTTVGLILLAELGLRIRDALAPATESATHDSAAWGRRFVHLNHEGFRDEDHAITPPKGTHRLLVVGDSFGFGYGVKYTDQRFGEQLAKKLIERTGQKWEAINACEPGAHTLNEIEILKRTLVYRPDVVILVYVFNDFDYRDPREIASHTLIGRSKLLQFFSRNSYLFEEIYCRAGQLPYEMHWVLEQEHAYLTPSLLSPHLRDVSHFVALAKQTGALVGVVPFDNSVTRSDRDSHRDNVFVESALAEGIPVWPLTGAFDGLSYSQLIVSWRDTHPNELANKRASEVTTDRLIKELLANSRLRHTPIPTSTTQPRSLIHAEPCTGLYA